MKTDEAFESFDDPYVIHYPKRDARCDGGIPPLVETRERLTQVESQMESNAETLGRIEETVTEVREKVQKVDNESLDKDRFDKDFKPDIKRSRTVVNLLVWGGGVILGLLGLLSTLASIGYVP